MPTITSVQYKKLKNYLQHGYAASAGGLAAIFPANPIIGAFLELALYVLQWSVNKILDSFDVEVVFDPDDAPKGPYVKPRGEKYVPFKYFDQASGADITEQFIRAKNPEYAKEADKIIEEMKKGKDIKTDKGTIGPVPVVPVTPDTPALPLTAPNTGNTIDPAAVLAFRNSSFGDGIPRILVQTSKNKDRHGILYPGVIVPRRIHINSTFGREGF